MHKRGEYQDFPWKNFGLTVPKISVGGNLLVFHQIRDQKTLCFRGLCHDSRFPVEDFLSHSAEIFRR